MTPWFCPQCKRAPNFTLDVYPPLCGTCRTRCEKREEERPPVVLVWDDLGYVVRYTLEDYSVTFDVFSINCREATAAGVLVEVTKGLPIGMGVEKKNANAGCENADDLDDASVRVHGFIKWDGCSHLSFPETEHCMLHLCGLRPWLDFANLMARLPKVLGPLIPKWDATVAV